MHRVKRAAVLLPVFPHESPLLFGQDRHRPYPRRNEPPHLSVFPLLFLPERFERFHNNPGQGYPVLNKKEGLLGAGSLEEIMLLPERFLQGRGPADPEHCCSFAPAFPGSASSSGKMPARAPAFFLEPSLLPSDLLSKESYFPICFHIHKPDPAPEPGRDRGSFPPPHIDEAG